MVERLAFKSAREVYVLADSSKFEAGYVSVICPVKDAYKIITDSKIEKEYIKKAEKEQIPLVVAKHK